MTKNPNKWIRKAVKQSIEAVSVVPVYDVRVAGSVQVKKYILLSTQTKSDNRANKCTGQWDCTILIDVVCRYLATGNPGSRVEVDDLEEEIINAMNTFSVDGFSVFLIEIEDSTDLDSQPETENIFRQLMRYRIILDEF